MTDWHDSYYEHICIRLIGDGARHMNMKPGAEISGHVLSHEHGSLRLIWNGMHVQFAPGEYEIVFDHENADAGAGDAD